LKACGIGTSTTASAPFSSPQCWEIGSQLLLTGKIGLSNSGGRHERHHHDFAAQINVFIRIDVFRLKYPAVFHKHERRAFDFSGGQTG
jgi:hypothetical protein